MDALHGTLRPDDGTAPADAFCRICGSPITYRPARQANRPVYCQPSCREIGEQHYRDARKAQKAAYDRERRRRQQQGTMAAAPPPAR
jgi:hypothetical protein